MSEKMCSNDELKKAIENLEKSLINSRDRSSTISTVMLSFQEKLDKHNSENEKSFTKIRQKIDKQSRQIEPILEMVSTANTTRRGVIWVAGFILALGTIVGVYYKIRDLIIVEK